MATIKGTNKRNILKGTSAADTIFGLGGNDDLYGFGGTDTLFGGMGGDKLFGGSGNDRLFGGSGNDALFGGIGNDALFGGSGNDRLLGETGNNTLFGGIGNDTLFGGIGNDVLIDGLFPDPGNNTPFNDTLFGRAGNDMLDGGAGNDRVDGGDGHDTLKGGAGNNTIIGGLGIDTVSYTWVPVGVSINLGGNTGQSSSGGGLTFSFLDTYEGIENVIGSDVVDSIRGDFGNNILQGLRGHDSLEGGWGNDIIYGGPGNDRLLGDYDFVIPIDPPAGLGADDILRPGGGLGADIDFDTVNGGPGNDWVDYSDVAAGVTVNLATNMAGGAAFGDSWFGVENVIGSLSADDLTPLDGGSAYGSEGNDTIRAVAGGAFETLIGGPGNDTLIGADGEFYFLEYNLGRDTIGTFDEGTDLFKVLNVEFGLGSTLSDAQVIESATPLATISGPQFIYETDTEILWFDRDGTSTAIAPVEIVLLQGFGAGGTLEADDFLIV